MRLIMCPSCGRQYDVSAQNTGDTLLCHCGEDLIVADQEAHEPEALRCPSCGGPLDRSSRTCTYCTQDFSTQVRNLTAVCPQCMAQMSEKARYCMECGLAIRPQSLVALPKDKSCPRCDGLLGLREIRDTSFVECTGCLGIWLTPTAFQRVVQDTTATHDALLAFGCDEDAAPGEQVPFKYLDCLTCGDKMVPRLLAPGTRIVVDICGKHGVWFDYRELQDTLRFIRSGVKPNIFLDRNTIRTQPNPQPPAAARGYFRTESKRSGPLHSIPDILLRFVAELFLP